MTTCQGSNPLRDHPPASVADAMINLMRQIEAEQASLEEAILWLAPWGLQPAGDYHVVIELFRKARERFHEPAGRQ